MYIIYVFPDEHNRYFVRFNENFTICEQIARYLDKWFGMKPVKKDWDMPFLGGHTVEFNCIDKKIYDIKMELDEEIGDITVIAKIK